MIHINLLPEEYRRKARTPVRVTLAFAGVCGVNSLLLAWFAWLSLGVKAEINSEKSVLQTELDGLAPQVTYHKSLETERRSFALREETLASITKNRINWTRKVDELIDVINSGGEGERHYIWLDDLQVSQAADPRNKSAGSIKSAGHSGSDKFEQIANFLDDLERSPFAKEFMPPAPPEGSQSLQDKELIPAVVWAFPLQLTLKEPEEREGKPAGAKGAAPKAAPEAGEAKAGAEAPGAKPAEPENKPADGKEAKKGAPK